MLVAWGSGTHPPQLSVFYPAWVAEVCSAAKDQKVYAARSPQRNGKGFVWRICFCTSQAFSRMRSKGSGFTLGVWGLRVCSLDVAFVVATVRNRSQPSVRTPYGNAYGKFCRGGHFWRFPMCRCFVSRGRRGTSWFAWQAQYFCDVFRRCVAVFVAGAALWTCPSSFFVAGAAL